MRNEHLTARTILIRSASLVRRKPLHALVPLLVLAGLGVWADSAGEVAALLLTLVAAVAGFFFIYHVTKALLIEVDLLPPGYPLHGVFEMFILLLLTNLAIIVGIFLFIIPGIYLLARFFLVVPILLAEDGGITRSMRRSGEEAAGNFPAILVAMAVIYLPMLAGLVLSVAWLGDGLTGIVTLNLLINASSVFGWYAAVAIYASGRSGEELVQVFA